MRNWEQGALRSEWPALYQQRNVALAAQARSLQARQKAVNCFNLVYPALSGRLVRYAG